MNYISNGSLSDYETLTNTRKWSEYKEDVSNY